MDNELILNQYKDAVDITSIFSKTDSKGYITYVNDKFCEISGYTREELIGHTHSIVRHPDMPSSIFKEMWHDITDEKVWSGVIKNRKKDGSSYYVNATIYPIKGYDGNIIEYISIRQDITEIVRNKKLLEIYTTDQITNLPNRQKLSEKLLFNSNILMAVLLDIKSFSVINELYGEEIGNSVLQKVAMDLKSYINTEDTTLYKINADQYLLLVENSNLFNRYLSLVEFTFLEEENFIVNDINVDFNIGIAYGNEDLLNKASLALKEAKNRNIGYFVYDDSIDIKEVHKKNIKLFNDFKDALENHRVEPYFQPIVDAKSDEVVKYEALGRLIDNNGNTIPTAEFMDIAQKSRFFENFTRQIIQKIFAISSHSNKEIAINLTYENINSKNLVEYIEGRLKTHNNGSKITFEILESEEIKDYGVLEDFIEMVKGYGCLIAIDDFGSGYSNFLHLVRLKPDFLKIDGSIISKIESDENSKNIVSILVNYARVNSMKIVAEYVSSESIANILKDLGVDLLQGYLYGKAEKASYYNLDKKN